MRRLFSTVLLLFFIALPAHAEDAAEAKKPTFTITAIPFLDKGILPVLYTCDGKDQSPGLAWTDPPAGTEAYALIMEDREAPGGTFYHWVLYNIPKSITSFAEGEAIPASINVGKNSANTEQYKGPCPPKGASHTYIFTLYALKSKLDLPSGADAPKVLEAIKDKTLGQAETSAVYSRWIN